MSYLEKEVESDYRYDYGSKDTKMEQKYIKGVRLEKNLSKQIRTYQEWSEQIILNQVKPGQSQSNPVYSNPVK